MSVVFLILSSFFGGAFLVTRGPLATTLGCILLVISIALSLGLVSLCGPGPLSKCGII